MGLQHFAHPTPSRKGITFSGHPTLFNPFQAKDASRQPWPGVRDASRYSGPKVHFFLFSSPIFPLLLTLTSVLRTHFFSSPHPFFSSPHPFFSSPHPRGFCHSPNITDIIYRNSALYKWYTRQTHVDYVWPMLRLGARSEERHPARQCLQARCHGDVATGLGRSATKVGKKPFLTPLKKLF